MKWSGFVIAVTTTAAGVALLLSVVNFIELRWRTRKASLSARYEVHHPPPFTADHQAQRSAEWLSGASFERVVVTNHGPAEATDVNLRIVAGEVIHHTLDQHFPVPRLHAGQDYYAEITRSSDQWGPQAVELTWRDRRRSPQSTVVHLSPQKII